MSKTVYDIRQYLDDKRIYKSLKGHEIDFSFRPAAIDEMYKKYIDLERQVAEAYPKYVKLHQNYVDMVKNSESEEELVEFKKKADEEVEKFTEITEDARNMGISLILVAAESNNRSDVDLDWINKELDPREFGFIIRFIMGTEDTSAVKKKLKNSKQV